MLFGFFVMGFCDVVGISTSYVKADFGLSETLAGFIPSMVFLWFLLLSVPTAMAMNRLGRKTMVQISNVITIVGMLVPFVSYGFVSCMAAFALLGIGNTIIQVALNPLLASVVKGDALTSSLTAGQVVKAVSSFLGPFIAAFAVLAFGNWQYLFPIFAGITFLSALWLQVTPIDEGAAIGKASTFGETITALELAPEGTNYRAKTRFAKFFNLPELMLMFREVADIQTADMLKLPVPKVNYHNIKTKPSEIQTEMVASLAKRAEKVRARLVEPNIDNMLKITNDGRKLALDQRMIDPMLPDDPESKVNACVDNVYRIWEEHADTKATQLVFCDLSTPKNDGTFNVYDDMREKLIARGIPAEQIRFIHEATTDAQKKELFGKVRSGEVRVLFGSTPKMGAGTNVQDRLIAIHNLDCPWRPSDLEQRQGRIERQGNMFPEVEVYRYVTEQTFDAYLYQLVESKQKFISQIMTSKSPVRSAEDVDEVALSFAEVKMLATGDARFKEKMDLDIQVSKLRVLKQSYLSEHYDLEDRVLKYYPQTIKEYEERIAGYENDAALVEQHKPQGEDKFCPMTLKGMTYTEKADAGEMLLAICKDYPMSAATEIGSYRGFRIEIYYDTVNAHYCMNLCGKAKHKVDLGADALGNLTRIENELSKLPARLEAAKTKKAETIAQLETAKEEIKKPFAFEDELKEKTERLNALNIELNLNEKDTSVMDTEPEQAEEQPERKCASRER